MKLIISKEELINVISGLKSTNTTIGFVPTMGALHRGHLSLVTESVKQNHYTVASIFVNPTQFNNPNDLKNYPRMLDHDLKALKQSGCDIVFAPETNDIYDAEEIKRPFEFDFKGLDKVMEGKFRPNHFNGVVHIVSKLFELVRPDRAYFGEKDFQQLAIIRLMTDSYDMPVEIVSCPIVREKSGLAMSSRNMLLSEHQRDVASHIYAVLKESLLFVPNTPIYELKQCTIAAIEQKPELKVEYFEIVNGHTLQDVEKWEDADYIVGCVTVYCGNVRLIDNICYKKL
ncbi:MAG: pantoate--beta-alanine ligase [Porphyromonadaceae bacterium]|nr:pantoate--beta-alanine ligase [Porphyromonadaceae bacterium]